MSRKVQGALTAVLVCMSWASTVAVFLWMDDRWLEDFFDLFYGIVGMMVFSQIWLATFIAASHLTAKVFGWDKQHGE